MKELLLVLVFTACIFGNSVGQEVRSGSHEGNGIVMSYSVNNGNSTSDREGTLVVETGTTVVETGTTVTTQRTLQAYNVTTPTPLRGHVGVWRERGRGRGNRRLSSHDQHDYVTRRREHRRRERINPTHFQRRNSRRRTGTDLEGRIDRRRQELQRRLNNGRLVATGTHSVSHGTRRRDPGIDPFAALQNGQRQSGIFQNRETAYDFLSNGGNSFRERNIRMRERRAENARMASVMCGVFGKQFIPSAIGGRCV